MQKYTARIHVGDAARIILAGLRHREVVNRETSLVTLYNCVDDSPEGRTSVDLFAASILSAPEGTTEELLREFDQSRFTNTGLEEKRVSNRKAKNELEIELLFPSYREGLTALHAGNLFPFN